MCPLHSIPVLFGLFRVVAPWILDIKLGLSFLSELKLLISDAVREKMVLTRQGRRSYVRSPEARRGRLRCDYKHRLIIVTTSG
jgi:hypothetical protein